MFACTSNYTQHYLIDLSLVLASSNRTRQLGSLALFELASRQAGRL